MSRQTVAVIGQGYVGFPVAVAAAEAGHHAVGIDRDKKRVDMLNEGRTPTPDVSEERFRAVVDAGRYVAHSEFTAVSEADVVVLCVPTPYHNQAPDLSYVEDAARGIAPLLRPGVLVILESTTYPGTTDELLRPILEQGSGLSATEDFDLVFSPERIDPGNPNYALHNTPKIVGGLTPAATERARQFYSTFVDTVVPVSAPIAAEMAKLLENTFRHINIALVNELAILCRDLHVNVWEVIDAAATKPFGFMPFYPGPGVGGHCIPVDPMYLSWRVRQFGGSAKFIDLARDVNAAMPDYCVTRVQELLNERRLPLNGSRVLVLGVAYKPDISDLRESPALALIEGLQRKGAIVTVHDPHVGEVTVGGETLNSVMLTSEQLRATDCVVVLTPHSNVDYDLVLEHAPLIFDTRNVFRDRQRPTVHPL